MHSYKRQRNINPSIVIITGTMFIFSTFSLVTSVYRSKSDTLDQWDLLIFSQNWPMSVCSSWMVKGKNHTCKLPLGSAWTVHGVWPTKLGTTTPSFCDKSKPFNPQALYGIMDRLLAEWTPIQKHKTSTYFWSHEWEKHGTCAAALPALNSEFSYFYQALDWNEQYNMNKILSKAGIIPGNSYNVTDIWTGIQGVLKKTPTVACYENKNTSHLLEIRICFDKSLNLADCNGTVVGQPKNPHSDIEKFTNCPLKKMVEYSKVEQIKIIAESSKRNNISFLQETFKLLNFLDWSTF